MGSVVFIILLAIHIAIGTIAVLVGLIALSTPKPVEGRAAAGHRKTGAAFLWSMAVVIGTAAL
ncbi:MAG TPA: hypothetical protein VJQ56_13070, partial [Blastocatellia bacterium]|nr:hypothetical protein [Blastocatellia bacterium]